MKVALTSIMVDDQDRAVTFYTGVLGFKLALDIPMGQFRWITVTAPEGTQEVQVALEPNDHRAAKPFQQALYDDGIPVNAFASTDIHAEYERLTARGVVFRSPPKDEGYATTAQFDDTCGNWIQLFQA
ncbi:MAG TPA: VOC family protein [Longimicrobiaceae bacterium]|nr:VOC family protein [Longimicrobiaceae bacterium]